MDKETILKFYWDVFVSHVCQFYKMERDFIDKYSYEINMRSLSKNKEIEWDFDFVDKYKDRLFWWDITANEAIKWSYETITRFKDKIDAHDVWHYLGWNKSLIISEELLTKFKKLEIATDNPTWTKELKKKYAKNQKPHYKEDKPKRIDLNNLDKVFKNLEEHYENRFDLYEKAFLPIIKQSNLRTIFDSNFNNKQKYFFLEPLRNDDKGLTPEFQIKGNSPFQSHDRRGLFEMKKELILSNTGIQEGADRLYEIPGFGWALNSLLLVSENVKLVLEKFKLPAHYFHPVKLEPKRISTTTKFFLLHLDFDTLTKNLDYKSQSFYYKAIGYRERGHGFVKEKITNYKEYEAVRSSHREPGIFTTIYPNEYKITTDYDMYTYSIHSKFIVTEQLKKVLESAFPGQMRFSSAQYLRIAMDQKKYDDKVKRRIDLTGIGKVNFRKSADDAFFIDKVKRLKKAKGSLKAALLKDDEFKSVELKLNVLFPSTLKSKILSKKLDLGSFELLATNKFYTQTEYLDKYPETYKSVVIAEDIHGDSVGLLLEKKDDFLLGKKLYRFLHETGDIEEFDVSD